MYGTGAQRKRSYSKRTDVDEGAMMSRLGLEAALMEEPLLGECAAQRDVWSRFI